MAKEYIRTCVVCRQTFIRDQAGRKACICSDACRKVQRVNVGKKNMTRTERTCQSCGKSFTAPPCRIGMYCSRKCHHAVMAKNQVGTIRTSQKVPCGYCGKVVKQYKSRAYKHSKFCSRECYHAWDSLYKQTPAMKRKFARQVIAMSGKSSSIEERVATWLTEQGIQFERQIKVHYSIIDFKVGDTLIEVNGCYWHACAEHFPMITPVQQKRIARDKRVATYCRKRNIPFLAIWEHDINRGDFSALASLVRIP